MLFARSRRGGGLAAVLLFLATLVTFPVLAAEGAAPAQTQATSSAAAAPAAPAAPSAVPSAEQIQALVATLEDPATRAKLVEQLRALMAAQQNLPATSGAAASATPSGTAAPSTPQPAAQPAGAAPAPAQAEPADGETLGSRALSFLAQQLDAVGEQIIQVVNVFGDVPGILDWLQRQVEDPSARERWVELSLQFALIILAGVVIERFTNWLLNPARAALAARAPRSAVGRVPLLMAQGILDLLPIVAFVVVAYGILSASSPAPRVRMVALAIINATVMVQAVLLAARLVLTPVTPRLRLIPMGDETAAYLYVWIRRLSATAVYGYFIAEGAYVLGLPLGGYGAVLKLLGLLIATMLIVLILQNRVSVAEWLRGTPLSGDPANGEPGGSGAVLRTARRRFADVWHVLAIAYVAVSFGIWILNVYGGFEYLVRATLTTIAVVALARLAVNATNRVLRRGFRVLPELSELFPHLEQRANRYLPILHRMVKVVIWFAAATAVLNAWGVDSVGYLESPLGRRILGSVISITLILIISVIAWELVSGLIERALAATDHNGRVIERSARTRTLLPLLRNAFLVLLVTMVVLITLSELGVNIAPLLAGAGVIGLAIGFGSQTLVKDIITGLFILFEDAISVGDVVSVGGHSGVVESLSIRTIRLRDTTGAVHSVPFSSVTTVTNMTKDFSFAVFPIRVAYSENTDRVVAVLTQLGAELQADPLFAPDILAPLEIMGVDQLAESGIVIMARFKTRPIKQWGVQREFNRRMKQRFEELGIEIPLPHMQVVMSPASRQALAQPAETPAIPPGAAGQGA
ncbi:mechanosensitive ion channel domain-containing protein [Azospirillum sp. SYSU D00513]|uniref:mechanosensitive ion channel domain-containing protein n=1 Tax=Azospirillum sp. SYSU D00513 TaxID=2812561 RepID=UPI001A963216|nr:mechanosensitive ion channel domain-containing protein [Azospirillum sp. SYSU D00513]